MDQLEDFSFQLGHDEYCTEIKQIDIIQGADGVSPTELAQDSGEPCRLDHNMQLRS